jgi:hypothetical protein
MVANLGSRGMKIHLKVAQPKYCIRMQKMNTFCYTMRLIITDNLLKLAVKTAPVRSPERLVLRRFINSEYLKAIEKTHKHVIES